ncbi:hypothetical protein ACFWJM_11865 [Streptomyces sp. NPDC127077]|uniref:hypothetical protein n=1 Tax=Streptomyces sp. NPDC127077 TaxID=3347131 RepID=UPI0036560D8B
MTKMGAVLDGEAAVRTRLVERTCAWCGTVMTYGGRGRPPKYCTAAHRTRAWELRTAQARAERPVTAGGRTTAPVREVVERTETRTVTVAVPAPPRPAVRMSGQPYTLPEDAVEWVETLKALRDVAGVGQIYPFREQLARICDWTAQVLREAVPV